MKVAVIGSRGRIGERLVRNLRQEDLPVVEASRRTGVDSFTGTGLMEALDGAEVSGGVLSISPSTMENARIARWPGHVTVFQGAASYTFAVPDPFAKAADAEAGVASMRAPMPGLVKVVKAASGQTVSKGQPLLILEAMKMEHTVAAPHDGVIAEIAAEGAQVTDGTVLVRFEEAS